LEELAPFPDHSAALRDLIGQSAGEPLLSPHAVNAPMIVHWVEAMGDRNPVYVSEEAARAQGLDGIIAPPTMLQAWIMRGLRASQLVDEGRTAGAVRGANANDTMMNLVDAEGLTSVVATNCEQRYGRPLVIGDRLLTTSVIEDISDPKRTGLGTGRFITTRHSFSAVPDDDVPADPTPAELEKLAGDGEPVAVMRFRILKYLPPPPPAASPAAAPAERPRRPRPSLTQDNAFWFDGTRAHRLLIQRCSSCGRLRHPPLPACANCQSLEWDTVEASGRGTLYSFVVVHYPQVASFDYPLPIGLVELEEGTRVVANIDGVEPGALQIGLALQAHFVDFDDELTLPVFAPAPAGTGGTA
jgi:uncharacterized OB-fold protein/acyl dehydratase